MLQVEVNNFQSIEHATLDIEGFTTLVGKSNIGKSAFIRAVRHALTNSLGTSFVRHGDNCARILRGNKTCKCKTSVRIRMEGFDLQWVKGDADNYYIFNEVKYSAPGQGVPEFLLDSGFQPVKVGDSSGCIQVSDQFHPLFMLDQSGPAVAEAISDAARLDRISKATKQVEKDRREVNATKKVREKDIIDLQGRLERYEGLPKVALEVSEVETQLQEVERLDLKVSSLERFFETLSLLNVRLSGLTRVSSVEVLDLGPLDSNSAKLIQIHKLSSEFRKRAEGYKSLSWVEKFLSSVPVSSPVEGLGPKVEKVGGWVHRLRVIKTQFELLEKVSGVEIQDMTPLSKAQEKVALLKKYSARVGVLEAKEGSLTKLLGETTRELEKIEEEASELGICPTCTQPVKIGHSHE
jgi:hypothetical protein